MVAGDCKSMHEVSMFIACGVHPDVTWMMSRLLNFLILCYGLPRKTYLKQILNKINRN